MIAMATFGALLAHVFVSYFYKKIDSAFIDFGALFDVKMIPKFMEKVTKIHNEIYTDVDTVFCLVVLGFGAAQTSKTHICIKQNLDF